MNAFLVLEHTKLFVLTYQLMFKQLIKTLKRWFHLKATFSTLEWCCWWLRPINPRAVIVLVVVNRESIGKLSSWRKGHLEDSRERIALERRRRFRGTLYLQYCSTWSYTMQVFETRQFYDLVLLARIFNNVKKSF